MMNLRVKEIAKNKGWQLKDVANKLGITNVALSQQLNGNPNLATLEKIAEVLDVSVSALFNDNKPTVFACPQCGALLKVGKK